MDIVAVVNQKGGVGKTATVNALGGLLARAGQRVLLLDLDPQGSLTLSLGCDWDSPLYDWLSRYLAGSRTGALPETPPWRVPLLVPGGGTLDLIPGTLDLAALEKPLGSTAGAEQALGDLLAGYGPAYDVVLVDCPPSLGVWSVMGLTVSTGVLIPCVPEPLALAGVQNLLQTVQMVRHRLQRARPPTQVRGLLPTLVRSGAHGPLRTHQAGLATLAALALDWAAALGPLPVLPAIPQTVTVAAAAEHGQLLVADPRSLRAMHAYRAAAGVLWPAVTALGEEQSHYGPYFAAPAATAGA